MPPGGRGPAGEEVRAPERRERATLHEEASYYAPHGLAPLLLALAEGFPSFDSQLLTDGHSLAAAADDYGHMVHRQPSAVLKPGSVADVAEMVRFARRNGIKVAARGQGHSTQGQAQVEAGVVVDMSTLNAVREVNPADALVEGGARWILSRREDFTAAPNQARDPNTEGVAAGHFLARRPRCLASTSLPTSPEGAHEHCLSVSVHSPADNPARD